MTDVKPTPVTAPLPVTVRPSKRRWPSRPVMGAWRTTHRWLSLVLGLLLVLITTTGSVLLFAPEITQVTHPSLYRHTTSAHPISPQQALDAAKRRYPKLQPSYVTLNRGVYEVEPAAGSTVNVDPGTGKVLGRHRVDGGPVLGAFTNFHDCLLTCKQFPLHVGFLEKKLPGVGIQGLAKVTIGAFILGATGVVFLYLVATGLMLWWPGWRKLKRGFTVRWGRGRYKRDYDLHKVMGFAVIPFLAMWAFTGANFELPVMSKIWYGLLPGQQPKESELTSKPGKGPDIGYPAAERAALKRTGGGHVKGFAPPAPGDPTGTYTIYIAKGTNPYRASTFPSNHDVSVDRRDASRTEYSFGDPADPASSKVLAQWGNAAHFGYPVGWLPRIIWFVFGMMPLALAITGLSTWLYKRPRAKARRLRRRQAAELAAAPTP